MQTDIYTLLDLEGGGLQKSKNVLVSESKTNGNFILSYYIAAYLKNGYNVCLVGLGQSFVHYGSIASKLGVNLPEAQNAGTLTFVDGLALVLDTLSKDQDGISSPFCTKGGDTSGLQEFLSVVLNALTKPAGTATVLIFDDVNALLDLGYSWKEVADFLQYTAHLRYAASVPLITVWMLHAEEQVDDPELQYIKSILKLESNTIIQLNGLKTGFSSDVHGEIEVTHTGAFGDPGVHKAKSVMQYKVADRSVSLFARGTSSAVL